jgi:hypothetical protein
MSLMAAQNDSTVGMEWVSRVLTVDEMPSLIDRLEHGIDRVWDATGWVPDGRDNVGNHIHVGVDGGGGLGFRRLTISNAQRYASAFLAQLGELFDRRLGNGGAPRIRSYNGTADKGCVDGPGGPAGSWLRWNDRYGTFEYRLWNTPADPRRERYHIAMSVAITRWAFRQAIDLRYSDGEIKADYRKIFDHWDSNVPDDELLAAVDAWMPWGLSMMDLV